MKHDPNPEQAGANSAELTVELVVESELQAMLAYDGHHWWYRGRRRVLRAELDRLPRDPGWRALDAGCGSGRSLDELAAYAPASGVDLNPVAVAAARGRGHADVRVGAIELLPYPSESFDLITCLDVLEHVPDDVLASASCAGSRVQAPRSS